MKFVLEFTEPTVLVFNGTTEVLKAFEAGAMFERVSRPGAFGLIHQGPIVPDVVTDAELKERLEAGEAFKKAQLQEPPKADEVDGGGS